MESVDVGYGWCEECEGDDADEKWLLFWGHVLFFLLFFFLVNFNRTLLIKCIEKRVVRFYEDFFLSFRR